MITDWMTDFSTEPLKGGKGSDFQISNAEFIAAVFPHRNEGAFAAVCSTGGDPNLGGWANTQSSTSEYRIPQLRGGVK